MKNYIITLMLLLGLMGISGCGSNTKADPIIDTIDINGSVGDEGTTEPIDPEVPIVKGDYAFYNIPSVTVIDKPAEKYPLKIQLINKKLKGEPDQLIEILAYSTNYGEIEKQAVKTDANGFANFIYTAPASIDTLIGKSYEFDVVFDANGRTIDSAKMKILFADANISVVNTALPIVVVPNAQKVITLKDNSAAQIEIRIQAFKDMAPYGQGTVKVELPTKVLTGVDVGQFEAYSIDVDAQGIALFKYSGPANLQSLINSGDTQSIFKFYHADNSADKQTMTVKYEMPQSTFVNRNYTLDIITADSEFKMGIPAKEKVFSVLLRAEDSSGKAVDLTDENITKITVATENEFVAKILDTSTTPATEVKELEIATENSSKFTLKSNKTSGLVPLHITMEFKDANGDAKTLEMTINVMVFSGPPSAISISYVGTDQDSSRAKYIEKLAISVEDEYGNQVNTRPNISLGAIVGYAVDGKESTDKESYKTRRLFYGKSSIEAGDASGIIDTLGDSDSGTTNFEDTINDRSDVFQYVNGEGNNTDKLVVFGAKKAYEAMGKWDILKGTDNHTLTLQDGYYGVDRSELYYAVGHNYYQDQCLEDGREWVGTTSSESYQLDEEGTVIVSYKYDYHLTGKDPMIWVNLDGIQPDTGKQTRIGEAVKHTLRGIELVQNPEEGYTVKQDTTEYVQFDIWHKNAPERYRNAHFRYDLLYTGECKTIDVAATSNSYDARKCDNTVCVDEDDDPTTACVNYGNYDGQAYVVYKVEAGSKDCYITIKDIFPSQEF